MADNAKPGLFDWNDPAAMERRIFYLMCALNAAALLISALFFHWKITTGVILGGALAWLNYQWLRSSIAAAFSTVHDGAKLNLGITRYLLRYLAIGAAVGLAYWLDVVSVIATLAALGTFAVAAMAEGFVQTYFAVVHKEGN